MAPVYHLLGLTTGVLIHDSALQYDPEFIDDSQYDKRLKHFRPVSRKEAYACDILYGTNNEFGFDYLRDNMVPSLEKMAQRKLYYAIVDEVDSILIDEARTPLIISAPAEESTDKYNKFMQLVGRLKENEDYNIDEKMRAATLTDEGISKMEKWLGVDNIYTTGGVREVHHIEQDLKAQVLFKYDRDYVVKDGEVIIVDEFTGRLMHGRRYSEGLHQAIEAKEGVKIQRESETLATITFQNYFRMYEKLAGMTGTAATEAEEFSKIYNLETVIIPTHKPNIRKDFNDLIYKSEIGKFKAIIQNVKERHEKGQPVLIGTVSIEKNELLARFMEQNGLQPQVLNAKNHEKEAKMIAQAGKPGVITIATNMAGRGVDIILGGDPVNKEEQKRVLELGGLHVIGTERHESRRIENKLISKSIESAQTKVEGNNFDIRKHLVEYDDVINKHRETIYKKRFDIIYKADNREEKDDLSDIVLGMVENEIEQVVGFHTSQDKISDWNLEEIREVVSTIFTVEEKIKENLDQYAENGKLDKAKARTQIIEYLVDLSKGKYKKIKERAEEIGLDWKEIEKSILIRSIDTLWIEHLEAMSSVRQGIGLRGYGQRDPLVEYKKEAFRLFNELNSLIQKEVVYGVYKLGITAEEQMHRFAAPGLADRISSFSAPQKTMEKGTSSFSGLPAGLTGMPSGAGPMDGGLKDNNARDMVAKKLKNEDGIKVGRNDSCPCGSGKKYKKCCGK